LLCGLFEQILLPAVVLAELKAGSPDISARLERLPCFVVADVPASKRLTALLLLLDAGEANAIELATSLHLPLIIDERKGRQIAKQFGIRITGFAGLLIQANRSKLVDTHTALAMLDEAVTHGLRLAPSLHQQVRDVLEQTID